MDTTGDLTHTLHLSRKQARSFSTAIASPVVKDCG